jgi:hypothetical protein
VESLLQRRHECLSAPAWFQQRHPQAPLTRVAYFGMEFGLSEALPIYSGRLGKKKWGGLRGIGDPGGPGSWQPAMARENPDTFPGLFRLCSSSIPGTFPRRRPASVVDQIFMPRRMRANSARA